MTTQSESETAFKLIAISEGFSFEIFLDESSCLLQGVGGRGVDWGTLYLATGIPG